MGACVARCAFAILLGMSALIPSFRQESGNVGGISNKFKPGMTVEQLVAVFPTDFFIASINVPLRTWPCRDASGRISPPEEYPVYFPDMRDDDAQGKKLAWQAAQLPLRLDRFELLDKHLRTRNDWQILVQAWAAYIQDSRPADAVAYCRRGSAYLAFNDFAHGYTDIRESCKLRCQECCTELKKLPQEKVTAFEAEEKRAAESALACEPPISSFSLPGPVTNGKFRLRTYLPDDAGEPKLKTVSRTEFADLLNREFKGREWIVGFTYLTGTPEHLSFHFVVGRDGIVKTVSPVRSWD
jgi:hypothetical protein